MAERSITHIHVWYHDVAWKGVINSNPIRPWVGWWEPLILCLVSCIVSKWNCSTQHEVLWPILLSYFSHLCFLFILYPPLHLIFFFPVCPLTNPFPIVPSVRMAMQSNLFSYLSLYSPSSITLSLLILKLSFCLSPFPVISSFTSYSFFFQSFLGAFLLNLSLLLSSFFHPTCLISKIGIRLTLKIAVIKNVWFTQTTRALMYPPC